MKNHNMHDILWQLNTVLQEEADPDFDDETVPFDEQDRRFLAKFGKELEEIKSSCSQVLALYQSSGLVFYRGCEWQESDDTFVFKRKSRDEREPISGFNYGTFNLVLKSNGIVARRDNSIFVTSDYHTASGFGQDTYMIFPVNGFHFTYTNEPDFKYDEDQVAAVVNKFGDEGMLKRFGVHTTNLSAPLTSGYEVLINGEYWAISVKFEDIVRQMLDIPNNG